MISYIIAVICALLIPLVYDYYRRLLASIRNQPHRQPSLTLREIPLQFVRDTPQRTFLMYYIYEHELINANIIITTLHADGEITTENRPCYNRVICPTCGPTCTHIDADTHRHSLTYPRTNLYDSDEYDSDSSDTTVVEISPLYDTIESLFAEPAEPEPSGF